MVEKYEYKVTWSEEDQAYIGRVAEFPSLAVHGDTPESAFKEIQNVVACVLQDMREDGEEPPQPFGLREYSGKLNLRMPKQLHRELAKQATLDNVSLNQLIVYKLSKN